MFMYDLVNFVSSSRQPEVLELDRRTPSLEHQQTTM